MQMPSASVQIAFPPGLWSDRCCKQQRKSSFATQKVAATEKMHFRNGKKQQPKYWYGETKEKGTQRHQNHIAIPLCE